jgi:CBS domain-containing protein
MRVEEIMTRELLTVAPSTTLRQVAKLLPSRRISGVPVVEDGRLVGVLSESDIVAKETSGYRNGDVGPAEAEHLRRERAATTVGEAMAPEPLTIEPWMSIWAAADEMVVHDVNRLLVLDRSGQLVGIVTRDDLVRAFARTDQDVERDIRERLLPSVGLSPGDTLQVEVENGVVTISGEIDTEMACDCLRASVHLIPGVTEVRWHVDTPALVG